MDLTTEFKKFAKDTVLTRVDGETDYVRGKGEIYEHPEEPGTLVIDVWINEDNDYGKSFPFKPDSVTDFGDRWEITTLGNRWVVRSGK